MKLLLSSLLIFAFGSSCHGALMHIMSDCCGRGTSFANLGLNCDDLETTPDIAYDDRDACLVVMKACCSDRLQPVLCERSMTHRMDVGSCATLGNDTCYSIGKECCECCDLGIQAFHDGLPCSSMTTGTSCDRAFQQCCQSAAVNFDDDECTQYTSLCDEKCVNLIDSYVCECNPGNRLLEDNITCVAEGHTSPPIPSRQMPCSQAPCQHQCRQQGQNYECFCNDGFELMSDGSSCRTRSIPAELSCDRAPCQHQCRQLGLEWQCYCNEGYELMTDGYSCTDIDECAIRDRVLCNYAQRCLNTIGSYRCVVDVRCRTGHRYDPSRVSCVDIDECAEQSDNCNDQSICENAVGSFTCIPSRCPSGYYFDRNSRSCKDSNECSQGTHNCAEGFRCDNLQGSFTCTRIVPCGTGYTINGVTQECVDVDECSQRSHDCQDNEQCINRRGSYRCMSCPLGYKIDQSNRCSVDVDECVDGTYQCGDGTRCRNNRGSYECVSVCMRGFEYNRVLGACMDVDECRRGLASCALYEICQNTNGSFSCGCRRGFRPNSYGECADIDECREGRSECLPNQKCYNLQGQYQCRNMCRVGFKFNSVTNFCEDVDECAEGLDRCQDNQRCINQEGGYVCQCPAGHQANRERGTCEDIDECSLGLCRGTCQNLPGSYLCTCPAGYSLMENRVTCKDNDECDLGTDSCIGDEYCFNTRGGYKCENIICPRYYQLQSSSDVQCVKRCPANTPDCDASNISNSTISHTFVALPSISYLRNPIRLLTIGLPSRTGYGGTTETYFNLIGGNEDDYFTITRQYPRGLPTGYLSLKRPISGPYETILKLQIVTEVRNVMTQRTELAASSLLMIHIHVGQYTY